MNESRSVRRPGRGGFTVVELAVSTGVFLIVMIGLVALFQTHTDVARQQTEIADMQQAARGAQNELVRFARMAGRGGLVRGQTPNFLAVNVRNNVSVGGPDQSIAVADATTPIIVPGTDVLTVRGVFTSPLFQLTENSLTLDNLTAPTQGTIVVSAVSPSGVNQALGPLADAIVAQVNEPLIMVSSASDLIYAVVELIPARSAVDDPANPQQVTLGFDIGTSGGTGLKDHYIDLSAGAAFPVGLRSAVFVGILEEYRYYIRQQFQVPGDATSRLTPRLSRARFFANSGTGHPSNPGLADDIADAILDLQVAIGFDANFNDVLDEDPENPTAVDDWLFNSPDDDMTDQNLWDNPGGPQPLLFNLRITTLARTGRPDRLIASQAVDRIEDHDYAAAPSPGEGEMVENLYRRRQLTTIVDIRNQG